MQTSNNAIIIGSGVAGLATAIRLQLKGYNVTVYEKNDYAGGKLAAFKIQGYHFDAGPSLFTQPQNIIELFELANEPVENYFNYTSVDVACKYFYANGKIDRKNITLSKSKEVFTFNTNTAPDLINVDAEKMLVCTKKDNHSMAEWIYLYKHGALFLDRLEAIDALKKYNTDTAALAIIQKGLNDINFEIRKTCINFLAENKQLLNSTTIVEKIQLLAKMDPKSSVRATAISALAANNPNELSKAIILNAINDSSYVVVQKALNALYLFDKLSAVAKANSLENIESDYVQMAIANIYATQGDKIFMSYFINQFSLNAANKQYYIGKYFKTYLAKIDDETIEKGLMMIKTIALNAYQEKIEFNAKSTLADMLANADTEILKEKIKLIMKEIDAEK
mgnify:CR=1 FL=1